MDTAAKPIELEQFLVLLHKELELDEDGIESISADDHFFNDLGLDSMIMLELAYILEDQGVEIAYNDATIVETPREAYELYIQLLASSSGDGTAA